MTVLTVHRWGVPVDDTWHRLMLPGGLAPVLVAARAPDVVDLWQVVPASPGTGGLGGEPLPVDLLVLGTGHSAPAGAKHVASCLVQTQILERPGAARHDHRPAGALVWHLWTRPVGRPS